MMQMREAFGRSLTEIGKKNEKVVLLDADLYTSTNLHFFKDALPSQFIQMGIAEQNMFGWAAGLAVGGFIPFPSTFASFACKRALDQIKVSIAYPNLNVKIAGSYCGISASGQGSTHQTVEDIAIMRAMPNMRVLSPCDNNELGQILEASVAYEGPVYIRVLQLAVPDTMPEGYTFNWKPQLLRDGSDILLVATGYMTSRLVAVAEKLSTRGINAAVIHVPSIKPFDAELVLAYAEKCGAVLTAEDHSIYGGLGGLIAETLSENCPTRMKRIGYRDVFIRSGTVDDIVNYYELDDESIIRAAMALLQEK